MNNLGIEDVKGMCERNRPDVLVCSWFFLEGGFFFFYPDCGLCLAFAPLVFRVCFENSESLAVFVY